MIYRNASDRTETDPGNYQNGLHTIMDFKKYRKGPERTSFVPKWTGTYLAPYCHLDVSHENNSDSYS